MTDGGVVVAQVGVAQRTRGLQVEEVVIRPVSDAPEVPHPTVVESQHGRFYGRRRAGIASIPTCSRSMRCG
jgi:hypothetical protein